MLRAFIAGALMLGACVRDNPEAAKPEEKPAAASTAESAEPTGRGALAAGALANLLLPPKEPGKHAFEVKGCAATPEKEVPATRGGLPAPEKVEASALEGGVLLSHEVGHACCLSAATSVALEGSKVVVTETLSGTPCRCLCSSNLRTSVGLKPGTWQVEVKTVTPGKTWTAWTGELRVTK